MKKLQKTFKSNLLHFIIPLFYGGLGMIFLLHPTLPVQELDQTDYDIIILLLHQGQGVLFISFALLLFQIRNKSKRLYFSLNSTFLAIIFAILLMTCYFYYLLPSVELIFMGMINLFALLILIYDKHDFKKQLQL